MGLYTPTILGGNSYLCWFYDREAIKDSAHTGTSKGLSQAITRGPIRKFLPKYANVYVTIQSHGLSAGVRTHYVTALGVRNGLRRLLPPRTGYVVPPRTLRGPRTDVTWRGRKRRTWAREAARRAPLSTDMTGGVGPLRGHLLIMVMVTHRTIGLLMRHLDPRVTWDCSLLPNSINM